MLSKLKTTFRNYWKSILLFLVIFGILSKYADLFSLILESAQLSECINSDKNVVLPCKKLLSLSGGVLFFFGMINILLIIFKTNKELIIKFLFVYFSAATILYTTGIAYTDIEQQKVQLKLNEEYHNAKKENKILMLLQSVNSNKIEDIIKVKELEENISNRNIYYQVLQEESKLYLQYKVTASFALIVLSYILLLILLLQLNIDKLKILGLLLLIFIFTYPNY